MPPRPVDGWQHANKCITDDTNAATLRDKLRELKLVP